MSQTNLQQKFNTISTVIQSGNLEDKVLQYNNSGELIAVDYTPQGIRPQIVITSSYTSISIINIVVRCGNVTVDPIAPGKWVYNLPYLGEWTITVTFSDNSTCFEVLTVNEVKQYNIDVISTINNRLNNNSWETIKIISDRGEGSLYWSIGDSKNITLNGTVGRTSTISLYNSYNNDSNLYVYIVDFDHNAFLEGSGILFQGFKYQDNNFVSLCDTTSITQIDSTGYNYTYTSCNFPSLESNVFDINDVNDGITYNVLNNIGHESNISSLLDTINSSLSSIIKVSNISAIRCSINWYETGGNWTAYVTDKTFYMSSRKFYLPSEYEILGTTVNDTDYANIGNTGSTKQTQIEFYKNNTKVKGWYCNRGLLNSGAGRNYATRSINFTNINNQTSSTGIGICINSSGVSSLCNMALHIGIAPLFRI